MEAHGPWVGRKRGHRALEGLGAHGAPRRRTALLHPRTSGAAQAKRPDGRARRLRARARTARPAAGPPCSTRAPAARRKPSGRMAAPGA